MCYAEEEKSESLLAAVTPKKWTRDMDSFYNDVVHGYVAADMPSLTSGMDRQADWHVDR
jgi:hypothetical protein